ncbi:hypothetical protein [Stenomitos frigidus]|uniref:Uncharacterized protein n=1 Tax=Stenomitos frigidus ULC18 TaxID=2107698 RepID=A0A2T1DYM2_9CYAN|nr:hypothetical protein [Stenomitos frigidus]PSB25598.1 hypothetical protein C7B82_22525 [Stenomitos frigidus ULC18]
MTDLRSVFLILSPKSLPYASICLETLFSNALEALNIKLITDSEEDKKDLAHALTTIANPQNHQYQIFSKREADDHAAEQFRDLPHLQAFRNGHPCWRKITDPLLFAAVGEEMIILDPDLYFPNKFTFESTPETTLLLMWQPPSCLQPLETVRAAFNASVKLAHHVDIGVAQWRRPVELTWLNWLLGELGGEAIPNSMFVEAIVWSALAMKFGGAYLDTQRWHCWYNDHWKRLLIKSGFPVTRLLEMENMKQAKCFHATGPCKWWLKEACESGRLKGGNRLDQPSKLSPLTEFTPGRYQLEQNIKGFLKKIGYYSLINPAWDELEKPRRTASGGKSM